MYEDIINQKYPFKLKHPRMSEYDRCKQFMPFSALTGYKEAVIETERLTEKEIILDEEKKEILDIKLNKIIIKLKENPTITLTYFIKDNKKTGGKYKIITGKIKKIDLYKGTIQIENEKININNIIDINSDILD
jgi:hypothetical protein